MNRIDSYEDLAEQIVNWIKDIIGIMILVV